MQAIQEIPGVGDLTASALVAAVGGFCTFKSCAAVCVLDGRFIIALRKIELPVNIIHGQILKLSATENGGDAASALLASKTGAASGDFGQACPWLPLAGQFLARPDIAGRDVFFQSLSSGGCGRIAFLGGDIK